MIVSPFAPLKGLGIARVVNQSNHAEFWHAAKLVGHNGQATFVDLDVVMRLTEFATIVLAVALAAAPVNAQSASRIDSVPLLDSTRLVNSLATLSSDFMEGRGVGTVGGERARDFLKREFARIGLEPATRDFASSFSGRARVWGSSSRALPPCRALRPGESPPAMPELCNANGPTYQNVHGENLVGVVHGTKFPDRYIVVSSHYDHLGIRDGEIFNGADDNASGSVAVLSIAEWTLTHPPLNSILFAWFDGEEAGMVGSSAFVRRPPVPLKQIVADVNLDMISHSWKGELFAAGARRYPVMQPFIDSVRTVALVVLRQGHDGEKAADDWTFRSDQAPFHEKHIPYIHFGNEEHADYHRTTDTFARIVPGFYYRSSRTIAEFIRELDRSLDRVASVRTGGR
jgi:hypothetical protein